MRPSRALRRGRSGPCRRARAARAGATAGAVSVRPTPAVALPIDVVRTDPAGARATVADTGDALPDRHLGPQDPATLAPGPGKAQIQGNKGGPHAA